MKVLNLYAGMGGNRKLWQDVEVTAVENNEEIAAIYKQYFPYDTIIIGDAHEYLLHNFKKYDFVWSSIVCKSHSVARNWATKGGRYEPMYPEMKLYEEIIFLEHFFDGLFVVENVDPYYEPMIRPTVKLGRHLIWSNFRITQVELPDEEIGVFEVSANSSRYGFSVADKKLDTRKDQLLRNLVNPLIGLHILDCAKLHMKNVNVYQNTIDEFIKL